MQQRHLIQRHPDTSLQHLRSWSNPATPWVYSPRITPPKFRNRSPLHLKSEPPRSPPQGTHGEFTLRPYQARPTTSWEAQCGGLQDPDRRVQIHGLTSPDILKQGHVLLLSIECSQRIREWYIFWYSITHVIGFLKLSPLSLHQQCHSTGR